MAGLDPDDAAWVGEDAAEMPVKVDSAGEIGVLQDEIQRRPKLDRADRHAAGEIRPPVVAVEYINNDVAMLCEPLQMAEVPKPMRVVPSGVQD